MINLVIKELLRLFVWAIVFLVSVFIFLLTLSFLYNLFTGSFDWLDALLFAVYEGIMGSFFALIAIPIFFVTLFWRRNIYVQCIVYSVTVILIASALGSMNEKPYYLSFFDIRMNANRLDEILAVMISTLFFYGLARITNIWINNRARS